MGEAIIGLSLALCVSVGFIGWLCHKYKPWTEFGRKLNKQIDLLQARANIKLDKAQGQKRRKKS